MMRGASLFALARKMCRHQAFSMRQILWFPLHQWRFAARGESLVDIRAISRPRFGLALVPFAEQHVHAGRQVWLVTATPLEVASVMARRLGLTGAPGTSVEHVDGFYTGRLDGEILHGQAKADAIKALAVLEGFDLADCWGYSDSYNDVPLLEAVGYPVAIIPRRKVAPACKAKSLASL